MKYIFLILIILGLSSLFGGCAGFNKKSSKEKEKEAHVTLIDQRIQELELTLSNLNASLNSSTQNLGRRVDELAQKTADIDTNYLNLSNSLDNLSSKIDKIEKKENSLETGFSETQKNIGDIERKLAEIEIAKADLQNQIKTLKTQKSYIIGSENKKEREGIKEEAKDKVTRERRLIKEPPPQKPYIIGSESKKERENIIKEEIEDSADYERELIKESPIEKRSEVDKKINTLTTEEENEILQKALDDALELYRNGNYKEAIKKWQEVLIIDPENLEAKFNIEIAKEKIKSILEE
ncbi:MAG: hypothetical protein KGJ87_09315 [Planctomycetota bacterium]|nr:hypothetical protein [Planctomycetota bacterium]MDE1889730.1 hypothetical protein [Planctomycetota bacterium]MDE2217341.1 hypothetical protein [Planctomycetota bacterium]